MTTKTQSGKSRQRYSPQYKSEALVLAEQLGVAAAARQLGINENQLYNWRRRARLLQDRSAEEERLLVENNQAQAPIGRTGREVGHPKKSRGVLRQKPEVKYAFMQNHLSEFKITSVSRVLDVSRSGFYRFRQRAGQPTKRQQQRMALYS